MMFVCHPMQSGEGRELEVVRIEASMTQSRMSTSSSERANRKRTNDRAPVSKRADRKRMKGQGGGGATGGAHR